MFQSCLHVCDNQQQAKLSSLALLCQLCDLLGKIHNFQRHSLNPDDPKDVYVWQERSQMFDSALKRWHDTVPSLKGVFDTFARMLLNANSEPADLPLFLVHAVYGATKIKLNSLQAYPPAKSEYLLPRPEASRACFEQAEVLADCFDLAMTNASFETMPPLAAWAAWVGSRALFRRSQPMPLFDSRN